MTEVCPLARLPGWPTAVDDEPSGPCVECEVETAMGWRVRPDVVRDADLARVDVCRECGGVGFVDDDPGASPPDMRPT